MFIIGAAISFEAQSSMDIRQLAEVQRAHWRKFSRHSSIGESAGGVLAKVQWTLANGETPDCEIPTGEDPATRLIDWKFALILLKSSVNNERMTNVDTQSSSVISLLFQ